MIFRILPRFLNSAVPSFSASSDSSCSISRTLPSPRGLRRGKWSRITSSRTAMILRKDRATGTIRLVASLVLHTRKRMETGIAGPSAHFYRRQGVRFSCRNGHQIAHPTLEPIWLRPPHSPDAAIWPPCWNRFWLGRGFAEADAAFGRIKVARDSYPSNQLALDPGGCANSGAEYVPQSPSGFADAPSCERPCAISCCWRAGRCSWTG
ncbi:Hypothetical protein NGAL_HAMBI1189_08660 [Neorhizobium galegae bv. officinalis]|jgi:hypothetical protein|uniref:Uncharacterized protein n=1 Tax=Neorhizobium galegae bv. officinalis TaxID=323656 RepID=A0A0T7GDS7_NEOGA|nr:Hypothetical protein NGAL_HAMBI1189_08660 [Neorhizobium galegae bv. officinalis]